MITSKQAALTAINEALFALDYDCLVSESALESDDLVNEAVDALMLARELLTDKPYPELPLPTGDSVAYEAWILAREAEQKADGRA